MGKGTEIRGAELFKNTGSSAVAERSCACKDSVERRMEKKTEFELEQLRGSALVV